MIIFGLILLTSLLGISILSIAKNNLKEAEKILIGIVIGTIFFNITGFVLSCFLGIIKAIFITISLSLLIILLTIIKKPVPNKIIKLKKIIIKERGLIIILCFFLALFSWSQSRVILAPTNNGWLGGRSNYGDLPYHTALITAFAWGENFPPFNPIYAKMPLIYYFLADYFSAVMLIFNASLRESILIPTVLFSLVIAGLIYILTRALGGKIAAFIAPIILLFNGGLGFFYFLEDNKNKPFFWALTHIVKEYNHIAVKNNNITNFIAGLLVPERPLLFGLPVFLTILFLLFKQKDKNKVNFLFILAAALSGLMPIIHLYGLIDLFIITVFLALIDIIFNKNRLKKWLYFFGLFFILALPQLIFVFYRLHHSNFKAYFHFGWLLKPSENFFVFWFKNLGFAFPLTFISLISSKIQAKIKIFFVPFIIIFIIGNLFIFQPYAWDNIKIFLFIMPALAIIIALFFEQLFNQGKLYRYLILPVLFFLTISGGIIGFIGEPQNRPLLFNQKELETGRFIKNNTPSKAVFLTAPQHNSPASSLAGRQIIMGYPGNIWVHGIDYLPREKEVNQMFNPQTKEVFFNLIKKYQISYVLFGPGENFLPQTNKDFFKKNFSSVFDNQDYQIYQIDGFERKTQK